MAETADLTGDSPGGGEVARPRDLFDALSSPAVHVEDVERRFGAGRPPGAPNKVNRQILEMCQRIGGDPRLALARIMATPWDELRRALKADKTLEAAYFWLACVKELMPYVARKQPLDVAISGKVASFNINVDMPARGGALLGPDAIEAMLAEAARAERADGFDPLAGGEIQRALPELESDDETTA